MAVADDERTALEQWLKYGPSGAEVLDPKPEPPAWYGVLRIARYLNCSPWDIDTTASRMEWAQRAAVAMAAEHNAREWQRRRTREPITVDFDAAVAAGVRKGWLDAIATQTNGPVKGKVTFND